MGRLAASPLWRASGCGLVGASAASHRRLGAEAIPNLTALGEEGRGVYLPAQLQAISFPLSAGGTLRCASLLGLRHELADLAERLGAADGRRWAA